ncbi:MAG TPA: hypothetical protein VJS47_00300 [Rhizomicrobium sp.]|nr:hypothetical protein [Rhizomicrobium sp.]
MSGKELYVEFVVLGNTVKATAIDPETGLEASVVGPASAPQSVMAEAARRKLEYLKKKKTT